MIKLAGTSIVGADEDDAAAACANGRTTVARKLLLLLGTATIRRANVDIIDRMVTAVTALRTDQGGSGGCV